MPWWACLLAAVWFTGWWLAYFGWWLAWFQGEFPSLYQYDYFTAEELHKYGIQTPEELYRGDLIMGVFWSMLAAFVPFVGIFCGPIWRHGWKLRWRAANE